MAKLAIYSPNLGAVSETFIKKHMEEIAPNQTVVIAGSDKPPHYGHWYVNCPTYILLNRDSVYLSPKRKIFITILHSLGLKLWNDLSYNKNLIKFLTENNVKIILSEYLDYSTTIIHLAKKLGIKLYAHGHGIDVSAKIKNWFWRREYLRLNKIAGIITMSYYNKIKLVKCGLKKELIHVIPYGINLPAPFTKTMNADQCIKCIAVGRMVCKKAPLLLLESFKIASERNPLLTLDFIGIGKLYENAFQYVRENHLSNKVKLHGLLLNDVVMSIMKNADIFLQHSLTDPVTGDQEGLPVAILEAMAHCLPVISTIHAGIPEAVINNASGVLVAEGNIEAMAEAIIKLAENRSLRINMGIAGRKIVEEKYTWEIEKKSLLNLIDDKHSIAG